MFTSTELFGKIHTPKHPLHKTRARVVTAAPNELEQLFTNCFPADLLDQAPAGPNSRKRVYSQGVTFWTFLWQCLNPGSSCRSAVRKVMAWFALLKRPKVSEDDSPYCQARRRLNRDVLLRALHASAQAAEQRSPQQWRFHGREVIVGDGTISSAADTKANQRVFPQSARQKPGCGFPLVRWVALFSLASGALLEVAIGNKHHAELKLFRKIWHRLKAGMIYLADRCFCDYVTVASLSQRQVDTVLRLKEGRPHDFRKGKRLGRYDRLVTWQKPRRRTRTATQKLWASLPDQLTLRLIRYPVPIRGYRTRHILLVTTLLDPRAYPVAQLAELYLRRWRVELFLRDIKTTMQIDTLRCRTPAMLYRELLMHLIAYNLIRCLMVEAASIHDMEVARLSFKGSVDTLRQFSLVIAQARSRAQRKALINTMLSALAGDPVPERPHRIEPRSLKRRRKAYPFLTKPRAVAQAKLRGEKVPKTPRS